MKATNLSINEKSKLIVPDEYYSQDVWNMKQHVKFNDLNAKQLQWYSNYGIDNIDFSKCNNENIKQEIKYYCYEIIENKVNLVSFNSYIKAINVFFSFINKFYSNLGSIIDIEKEQFIDEYTLFIENSESQSSLGTQTRVTRNMETKEYKSKSIYIRYVFNYYDFIYEMFIGTNIKEFDKDRWDIRNLPIKVEVPKARPRYTISFENIYQESIKKLAKKFIYERLKSKKYSTCIDDLKGINLLSQYLNDYAPDIKSLEEIDRDTIEDYMSYVRIDMDLAQRTRVSRFGSVKTFFEICQLMGWEGAPKKTLITNSDYKCKTKVIPKFYDENELRRLNEHLDKLPVQIARMVFVIENIGMRISELCILKVDCIQKDTKDEYFLKYYQPKTDSWNRVPINIEIAEVIKESIKDNKEKFGNDIEYVFLQNKETPISSETFSYHLNKVSYENNILDREGKILRIKSHTFRGTVATKYANLGMSTNIIRMLLGQRSTGAIKHYVEIHDVTVLDAMKDILNYQDAMINNIGKIDNMEPINKEDKCLIPLPNGHCGKPISEGKCSHANACYSCRMFKANPKHLDLYKFHLKEAQQNIKIAEINGFERILQVNKELESNLLKIIEKIENTK